METVSQDPKDVKDLIEHASTTPLGAMARTVEAYIPVAERVRRFAEELEYQQQALELLDKSIVARLVKGRDFDLIQGTKKPTLLQPGAQRVCQALQLTPTYRIQAEHDPTRQTPYMMRAWEWNPETRRKERVEVKGTASGYYAAVVTCTLAGPRGTSAQGIGTCSNLEAKYVRQRCEDVRHTVLMIAAKRAYVAATRTIGCLSDRFTQDLEDLSGMVEEEQNGGAPAAPQAKAPAPPRAPGPVRQPAKPGSGPRCSEAQIKRLWAKAHEAAEALGLENSETQDRVRDIMKGHGFEHVDHITRDKYDAIVNEILAWGEK